MRPSVLTVGSQVRVIPIGGVGVGLARTFELQTGKLGSRDSSDTKETHALVQVLTI